MEECNSHNIYPNLSANTSNYQQFRLNKINEIKDYFIAEIKERELMSKRLSKYIASFDYFDKSLIVASVATGSISYRICKKKKKKHNKIVMQARRKLNGIESKISEALANNENSHEDFMSILNEEKKYREVKKSIRMMNIQRSDVEKLVLLKKAKKWVLMKLLSVMKLLIRV